MKAAFRVLVPAAVTLALTLAWPAARPRVAANATAAQAGCKQAPRAPTDLAVTVDGTAVIVSWRAANSGCPATSYVIETGSLPGQTDLPTVRIKDATPTVTLYGVPGGLYYVRVKGINAAGASEPSDEVRVCMLPPQPNGVFADVSGTTVSIVWNPAGLAPNGYLVEIGSSPGSSDVVSRWTATADPAMTVTAPPGTHFLRVRARNVCGVGPPSNAIVVPAGGYPGVPDVIVVPRTADRNTYFPTVERLRNGHLIVVYYDSPGHVSPRGRISLVKSVDGGRTWSSPKVAIDSPLDDRDPSVMQTTDGTLLLSYFSPAGLSLPDPPGIFVARSDDEGETWSAPVKVETAFGLSATSAKIVELESGELLIPIYGEMPSLPRSAVVRSTDRGRTWPKDREVQIRSTSELDLVEPALVNLGGGRLMTIMRAERPDGAAMESRSSDGGRTWSEPTRTDFVAQASDLLAVRLGPEGKTAVVHTWGDWSRRFGDSRATLMQAIEFSGGGEPVYGEPRLVYNSHCDDAAQPSSVALDAGRLFTVYSDACFGYIGGNFSTIDALRR